MPKHTAGSIREEASKYHSKCDFKSKANNIYFAAIRMGILADVTSHMTSKVVTWTDDMLFKEGLKYSSRSEFTYNSKSAYEAARKRGILDEVCCHMPYLAKDWTDNELAAEAAKYTYRTDFKKHSYNAYRYACNHNKLSKLVEDMPYKPGGFNKNSPAILYTFKIDNHWKIGVTNKTVKERYQKDYNRLSSINTVQFDKGFDAFNAEQRIIKDFERYRYTGSTSFTDGTLTTECFVLNVSKLSEVFNGK